MYSYLFLLAIVPLCLAISQPDGTVIPQSNRVQTILNANGDSSVNSVTNAQFTIPYLDVSQSTITMKIVARGAAWRSAMGWFDVDTPNQKYQFFTCTDPVGSIFTFDLRPTSQTSPRSTSGKIGLFAVISENGVNGNCGSLSAHTALYTSTNGFKNGAGYIQLLTWTGQGGKRLYLGLEDIAGGNGGNDYDYEDVLMYVESQTVVIVPPPTPNCAGVICAQPDKCHQPGVCNENTGVCDYACLAVATDGTVCPLDLTCDASHAGVNPPSLTTCPYKHARAAIEGDGCGGSGGHAMWTQYTAGIPYGFGTDRWVFTSNLGASSGVFQEFFPDKYGRLTGTLVDAHGDTTNAFLIDLELEYIGGDLSGTGLTIKNELSSATQCHSLQNQWYFYRFRTDVPSTLTGLGKWAGLTIVLGQDGYGYYPADIGPGASQKNSRWGFSTWLTYKQFNYDDATWPANNPTRPRLQFNLPASRSNDGDININLECPTVCPDPQPQPVCGNHVVELGEECDSDSPCCSELCQFRVQGFTCRIAVDECDVSERCPGNSDVCPPDSFAPATQNCNEKIGFCDARIFNKCPGNGPHCNGPPSLSLDQGLYSFENFNLVSFGGFNADAGDIEGRAAVKGDWNSKGGFGIGLKTNSFSGEDKQLPFALVVGHNIYYDSGSIWPDGSGNPNPSTEEGIFAGESFNGPQYLQDRVMGQSTVIGDRDAQFEAGRDYFVRLQNLFQTASADNVQQSLIGGTQDGLNIKCNSATDQWYYITVEGDVMSTINWYCLENCNLAAYYIINVVGTGDVTFKGGRFPAVVERVIYSVLGSGRTINVRTGLAGNLLAPNNILSVVNSVTYGLVVVGDVSYLLQANKPNCLEYDPVVITGFTAGPIGSEGKRATDAIIPVYNFGSFAVGDVINIGGVENCTITGATYYNNGPALLCTPLQGSYTPDTPFTTIIIVPQNGTYDRPPIIIPPSSTIVTVPPTPSNTDVVTVTVDSTDITKVTISKSSSVEPSSSASKTVSITGAATGSQGSDNSGAVAVVVSMVAFVLAVLVL